MTKGRSRYRIVGLFPDKIEAERAIHLLHELGLRDDQIGLMAKNEQELFTLAKQAGAVDRHDPDLEDFRPERRRGWDEVRAAVLGGIFCGLLFAAAALLIPAFGLVVPNALQATLILAMGAGSGALIGIGIGLLLGAIQDERTPPDRRQFYEEKLEQGAWVVVADVDQKNPESLAEPLKAVGAETVDIYA